MYSDDFDSVTNNLRDSANGTFVNLDDFSHLTGGEADASTAARQPSASEPDLTTTAAPATQSSAPAAPVTQSPPPEAPMSIAEPTAEPGRDLGVHVTERQPK